MYPDLWKFDKNEKSDPIQCQPGPKVVMTFYGDMTDLLVGFDKFGNLTKTKNSIQFNANLAQRWS